MTLLEVKMSLDATNALLERLVVAVEVIAATYAPLPDAVPRRSGIEALQRLDPAAEARMWEERRQALGLTPDEWATMERWRGDE